ncbi:tetratricopeptide repeat protein, partial [Verrucomicrobiota bacterium]
HSNQGHYYVGAKYPCSYSDFYGIVKAARGEPQTDYRNLSNPDVMVRSDPREQRLYYLSLLEEHGGEANSALPLEEIAGLCRSRGLIQSEAEAILRKVYAPGQITELKADLRLTDLHTDDQGFNGSPLYVLLRRLDPSLHFRFSPAVFWINLAWQLLGLLAVVWLSSKALGWNAGDAVLVTALLLASWDYVGWGMNGLVTAGWMLPALLAVWGYRLGRPLVAGSGIAWAGLIKLFPFALLMPAFVAVAKAVAPRQRRAPGMLRPATAISTVLFCLASAALLTALSRATGLSWTEFLEKIVVQFRHAAHTGNGVGLSHVLLSLGIGGSAASGLARVTALFCIGWMFWESRPGDPVSALPRQTLIMLACMVWLTNKWLNYYSVVGLLLVPYLMSRQRKITVLVLLLYAVSFALPEFGHLYPGGLAVLSLVKVAPHLGLPLFALIAEIAASRERPPRPSSDLLSRHVFRWGHVIALAGVLAVVCALVLEVYRHHKAASWFFLGEEHRAQGRTEQTRACFERAVELLPKDAQARFNLALVLEQEGNPAEALRRYREAVELDPGFVTARLNLGILLIRRGDLKGGGEVFRECIRIAPHEEKAHYNLGAVSLALQRPEGARRHLRQALRINPGFAEAKAGLRRVERRTGDRDRRLNPPSAPSSPAP